MHDLQPPKTKRVDFIAVLAGCAAFSLGFICIAAGLGSYWIVQALELGNTGGEAVIVTPIVVLEPLDTVVPEPTTQELELSSLPTAIPDFSAEQPSTPSPIPTNTPLPTLTPTPTLEPTPEPIVLDVPASVIQQPVGPLAADNLTKLWNADFSPYDYYDMAVRANSSGVSKRTVEGTPWEVGDIQTFTLDERLIEARLAAVTPNTYHWFETNLNYNDSTLQEVVDRLEDDYYPRLSDLFGSEWNPGVDNDPHFSILHFDDDGQYSELGFFDSINEYPRTVDPSSNEQEMIFMNMSQLILGEELYYGTLVHELQHLIQWNLDNNETIWLDEGLAQLAELYVGFQTAESVDYLTDTSLQLNTWSYEGDDIYAHYSATYLFMTYLWEQLGNDAIRELAANPDNGFIAVREVIKNFRPNSTLEQFMGDWAVANLLDDVVTDPRFGYQSYTVGLPELNDRIRAVPYETEQELSQYGVHYVDIRPMGTVTLTFVGDTLADMLPTTVPDGDRVWFAPPMNDSSLKLTRAFDLTGVNKATLLFSAWYELEQDFDFAYVEVSADGGRTWEFVRPEHAVQGIYGPAITGNSADIDGHINGWVEEAILLDDFTGNEILLRFEVLTDSAITGYGFAIDNIFIPEINFFDSMEGDVSAWQTTGFVSSGTQLPQQWSVQLVQDGIATTIPLNELNQVQVPIQISNAGATLIIMPQTPFIDIPAYYWLKMTQ